MMDPQKTGKSNKSKRNLLKKLASKLKKVNLEDANWIVYTKNKINKTEVDYYNYHNLLQSNLLSIAKELLHHCEEVQRTLGKYDTNNDTDVTTNEIEIIPQNTPQELKQYDYVYQKQIEESKLKYASVSEMDLNDVEHSGMVDSKDGNCTRSYNIGNQEQRDNNETPSLCSKSISELEINQTFQDKSFKKFVSTTHHIEEYVPQFTSNAQIRKTLNYIPTKVNKTVSLEEHQHVALDVRETLQHNANLTLFNKESRDGSESTEAVSIPEDSPRSVATPRLSDIFTSVPRKKSSLYKDVCCFYHSEGSGNVCAFCDDFWSRKSSTEEFKRKLSELNPESFIQEYMLTRSMPAPRTSLVLAFVDECIVRQMTRLLVEMTIDYIEITECLSEAYKILKYNVVERTLLYLNTMDLDVCDDLFKCKLSMKNDVLLCEFLLKTSAETSNFTIFKPIFLKLTTFICRFERSFEAGVAALLLERICILPYDETLARALIEVVKRTDVGIFNNCMIEKFENLLLHSNKDLYDAFVFLKRRKLENKSLVERNNSLSPGPAAEDWARAAENQENTYVCSPNSVYPNAKSPLTKFLDEWEQLVGKSYYRRSIENKNEVDCCSSDVLLHSNKLGREKELLQHCEEEQRTLGKYDTNSDTDVTTEEIETIPQNTPPELKQHDYVYPKQSEESKLEYASVSVRASNEAELTGFKAVDSKEVNPPSSCIINSQAEIDNDDTLSLFAESISNLEIKTSQTYQGKSIDKSERNSVVVKRADVGTLNDSDIAKFENLLLHSNKDGMSVKRRKLENNSLVERSNKLSPGPAAEDWACAAENQENTYVDSSNPDTESPRTKLRNEWDQRVGQSSSASAETSHENLGPGAWCGPRGLPLHTPDTQYTTTYGEALLFRGIAEDIEEDRERLEKKVCGVINGQMKVPSVRLSHISAYRREGARKSNPRPIFVRFSCSRTRDAVWKNKSNLKGSPISVVEFLSKPALGVYVAAKKHFGMQKCWTAKGRVYVLLPDGSRRHVASASELTALSASLPARGRIRRAGPLG